MSESEPHCYNGCEFKAEANRLALLAESYRSIIADLLFVAQGGTPRLPVTKSSICDKATQALGGEVMNEQHLKIMAAKLQNEAANKLASSLKNMMEYYSPKDLGYLDAHDVFNTAVEALAEYQAALEKK